MDRYPFIFLLYPASLDVQPLDIVGHRVVRELVHVTGFVHQFHVFSRPYERFVECSGSVLLFDCVNARHRVR